MGRRQRRAEAGCGDRSEARHGGKAGALAVASLALVPFLAGGGVPLNLSSTVDSPAPGADGRTARQQQLGSDILAAAGTPQLLLQQMPSFDGAPLDAMGAPVTGLLGIPESALAAYKHAADVLAKTSPRCHLDWSLLASIGRIESGHARGGRVDPHGTTFAPILGPVLNGVGDAAVADTDGGALDGDTVWDRAVGPMQFIPATWRKYAADGNGDGVADPGNLFDSAVAAGKFLCAGGQDLRDPQQRAQAVFRYNQSDDYVREVLLWADAYARGATSVPDGLLPAGPPSGSAGLPGPLVEAATAPATPAAPVVAPPAPGTAPAESAASAPTASGRPAPSSPSTTPTTSSTTTTTPTSTPPGTGTPTPACPTPATSTSDSTTTTPPPATTTTTTTTTTPAPAC